MDIIQSYKKHIVGNKSLVFISIFISGLLRFCFWQASGYFNTKLYFIKGYLWVSPIADLFSNELISLATSFIVSLIICGYCVWLNNKHKLIRERTFLVYSISILLLSSHPVFIWMNPQYISTLLLLVALNLLLGSYQDSKDSGTAYSIGVTIGVASLFSFSSISYIVLFWIGFQFMRSLNFKAILSSVVGIATIYWLSFCYFLWMGNMDAFYEPFKSLYPIISDYKQEISFSSIAMLTICGILLITIIIDYQANVFYDKIQTRANLSLLYFFALVSFLSFIFIAYDPLLNLLLVMAISAILLAHFFSLANQTWKVYSFYIFLFLYFSVCVYYFLSKIVYAETNI